MSLFDNITLDGTPVAERADSSIDAHWTFNAPARGLHSDWYSVRWEGELTVGADSVHEIGVDGTDGWRLFLDGRLLMERWHKRSAGVRTARVALPPGSRSLRAAPRLRSAKPA